MSLNKLWPSQQRISGNLHTFSKDQSLYYPTNAHNVKYVELIKTLKL